VDECKPLSTSSSASATDADVTTEEVTDAVREVVAIAMAAVLAANPAEVGRCRLTLSNPR